MDEAAYQQWWQLHVRVARGESLSPEETSAYAAGRRDLDEDENLRSFEIAKQARQELQALDAERTRLEQRRRQLDAEISSLESRLGLQARQLLGAEE